MQVSDWMRFSQIATLNCTGLNMLQTLLCSNKWSCAMTLV